MPTHQAIVEALTLIFGGIERLKQAFPNRQFTIDGRLVGDIGEIIAALEYDVVLHEVSQKDHDATTPNGRRLQIKATFKDSLTFKTTSDYYLGFKLFPDGRYEEVFNGPARIIYERFKHRKGIGVQLLSFSNKDLKALSREVPAHERIPKREAEAVAADPENRGGTGCGVAPLARNGSGT
jgi:hypothetical protein